jgi:small subunit ribosomal protein S6
MRSYEAVCIFHSEEDAFNRGVEVIKTELENLNASITNEKDMGQRILAYPVRRKDRGHFYLFEVDMEADKANTLEEVLKHKEDVLKFMLVKKDE